ncbi:uncharacterized protein LOC129005972 [Macrosteles quadrilineatus]|uniref:uncharacterized protein LOC128982149 n=1 Tax=Macrosteles quadrilineatus TaxID=74068 RepID=UPI0023E13A80|nr:uncharacterized protein LOC128982149 [Macrosteles quadrilineatus]XP_054257608.1 uncharacterized protein LOC128982694 [Macrosteles quadrilineatus]XP_054291024.1 uncharacterized protein LOC129005972 [Macrosteles quadrilineatus]
MLFLKRELRSNLEILRPNIQDIVEKHTRGDKFEVKSRSFEEGQKVAVRNYANPNKKWLVGRVVSRDGELNYTVSVNNNLWRRHADQIRSVGSDVQETVEPIYNTPRIGSDSNLQKDASPSVPLAQEKPQVKELSFQEAVPATTCDTVRSTSAEYHVPSTTASTPVLRRSSKIRKPPQKMNP